MRRPRVPHALNRPSRALLRFAIPLVLVVAAARCSGDRATQPTGSDASGAPSGTTPEPKVGGGPSGTTTDPKAGVGRSGTAPAAQALDRSLRTPAPLRSVLLVTVDTLRADRLRCYGYRAASTPAYDRIAREGALFENAVATNPLTLPSHASILTGSYPAQHGVHGNGNFAISEKESPLALILKEAGFRTGAFIGAFPLSRRFGTARGFDTFDDDFGLAESPPGRTSQRSERRAREVNARAIAWLRANGGARFFLWVHYFDPHFEYEPEEPFASRFPRAPYDGEVAATDEAIGALIAELDRQKLTEGAAVAIISDHGEGLGDHGEAYHGVFLYDTTIRVPFLLRAPGWVQPQTRIGSPVSGADVAPTLLRILGFTPPPAMTGRPLLSELLAPVTDGSPSQPAAATGSPPGNEPEQGRKDPFAHAVLCESYGPWLEFRWSPLIGVRSSGWKFIEAPTPEIYDLANDPGEVRNLASEKPELLAAARRALADLRGQREGTGESAPRGATAEEVERLRSLGYAAAGAPPRLPAPGGTLRDPKAMRGFEEAYYRAFSLQAQGRLDEAVASYRSLLAKDSQAPLVHHQLGRALRKAGRLEEAERELGEALRLAPDLADAAFDLGAVREQRGDAAGAETWFRRAIAINEAFPEAHAALARRRFAAGDLQGARRSIERAIALAPSDPVYRAAFASLPSQTRP